MQYNPHEYQTYATNFILEHPVAAVLLLGVWFKGDVSVGFIYMQF